jgi:carbon-monoxide dehydrogenase small subunit
MTAPSAQIEIAFSVNGNHKTVCAYPMERLLDVLRHQLELTGPKEGCGEGECGSCSVLLDGMLVNSCLIPVMQAQGARITTVEGLAGASQLNSLQQAILACGGAQCGICTPGILMAAHALLTANPQPGEGEIRESIAGNVCRCTGYQRIVESIRHAAKELVARESG